MSIDDVDERKRLKKLIKHRNLASEYNYIGERPDEESKENRSVTTEKMVRLKVLLVHNPEIKCQLPAKTAKKCVCGQHISKNHYWVPKSGDGDWLVLGSTCSQKNQVSHGICVKCFSKITCTFCKEEKACLTCRRRNYCENCDTKPREFYKTFTKERRTDTEKNRQYLVDRCLTLMVENPADDREDVVKILQNELRMEGFTDVHEVVEEHYLKYLDELEKQQKRDAMKRRREEAKEREAEELARRLEEEEKKKRDAEIEKRKKMDRVEQLKKILRVSAERTRNNTPNLLRDEFLKQTRILCPDYDEEDRVIVDSMDNEALGIAANFHELASPDPPLRQCKCGVFLANDLPSNYKMCAKCHKEQQTVEWKNCIVCNEEFCAARWKERCVGCFRRQSR